MSRGGGGEASPRYSNNRIKQSDSARSHRSLESFPRDYANISPLPHWFFSFPSTLLPTSTFHHLFSYIELELLLCARVYLRSTRKTIYIYIYVSVCVCTRVKRDKTDALAFFLFSNYRQRRYITETHRYLETFHFLKKKIYIYNFVITLLFSLSLFLSCPRCLLSLDWFRTSLNYYITRFIGDRKIGILFFPFFFPRLLDILKRWSRLHKNHFESSREMCHARPIKRYIGIVSRYTRFIDRNFGLASFPAHFRRYVRLLHGIKFLENRNVCVIFRGLSYRCKKQNFSPHRILNRGIIIRLSLLQFRGFFQFFLEGNNEIFPILPV